MGKDNFKNTVMSLILVLTLLSVMGAIIKDCYTYYTGPDYVVDTYVRALNGKDYNRLYTLMDKQSMKEIGNQKEIVAYYNRIYEKENRLINVQNIGFDGKYYQLQYEYDKGRVKAPLEVNNVKGKWYVVFPFEPNKVQVFAPYGAEVYLNSDKMSYSKEGYYESENILPGNYLLKVEVAKEGYKDYYRVLHIPEEKKYSVPYELGDLTVEVMPNFKVSCDQFTKINEKTKVAFENLLLGRYEMTAQDVNEFFEPQLLEVEIKKGNNVVALKDLKLSTKGENKLKSFMEMFYSAYMEAIEKHDAELINDYFEVQQAKSQKDIFSKWYINQKNIQKADVKVKIGEWTVDDQGYIHVEIVENVELENQEYDQTDKIQMDCYKVMITWETVINPRNKEWEIIKRSIKQSMVAIKDDEGQWIQY